MIRSITCSLAALALGVGCAVAPLAAEARTCNTGARASACAKPNMATAPATQSKHGAKSSKRAHKDGRPKKVDPHAPALDATTLACNDEYETNKAAIDGGGQSRAKFIKDCKNGTETIPGGAKTGAAPPAVSGPPPDKQLPPADPKSGRPVVLKNADEVTGSTKPKRQ